MHSITYLMNWTRFLCYQPTTTNTNISKYLMSPHQPACASIRQRFLWTFVLTYDFTLTFKFSSHHPSHRPQGTGLLPEREGLVRRFHAESVWNGNTHRWSFSQMCANFKRKFPDLFRKLGGVWSVEPTTLCLRDKPLGHHGFHFHLWQNPWALFS